MMEIGHLKWGGNDSNSDTRNVDPLRQNRRLRVQLPQPPPKRYYLIDMISHF